MFYHFYSMLEDEAMPIFWTKESKFKAALAAQDTDTVVKMLDSGYEPKFGWRRNAIRAFFDQCNAKMAEVFIKKKFSGQYDTGYVIEYMVTTEKFDLLDAVLETNIDFNRGNYTYHPCKHILACQATPEKKMHWIRNSTATGLDHVDAKSLFLSDALQYDNLAAFDLFVSLGLSPHGENEGYLRAAAKLGKKDVCLHLVKNHGADIALAIKVAGLRAEDIPSQMFLSRLQDELNAKLPAEKIPVTLETLSAEMREMRKMIEDMKQMLEPGHKAMLDKPASPVKHPQPGT